MAEQSRNRVMARRRVFISILTLVLVAGVTFAAQAGAKAMFYDPANGKPIADSTPPAASRLKPVRIAIPFPRLGFVGIHYWFQDASRTPFSDTHAAAKGGRFSLHIRSNTGGFLTVWSLEGDSGVQLTPFDPTRSGGG